MADRTDGIRQIARKWLADGTVEAVVGWEQGTYKDKGSPVLIRKAEDADRLLPARDALRLVPFSLEEDQVRAQQVYLVVDPEYPFRLHLQDLSPRVNRPGT